MAKRPSGKANVDAILGFLLGGVTFLVGLGVLVGITLPQLVHLRSLHDLVFSLIFSLLFMGGGALVFWRFVIKGARRKSKTPFDEHGRLLESEWPWFPKGKYTPFARESGYAHVLLPITTRKQSAVVLLIIGVFWTTLSTVMFVGALDDGFIIAVIFIGLFVLIGIGLLALAVYETLRLFLVGDTTMKVSRETISPGDRMAYRILQKGKFPISEATVRIICRETIRYQRGTDTITEHNDLWSQIVNEQHNIMAPDGGTLLEGDFVLPQEAMHSFEASNNEVGWILQLRLRLPDRPDVCDDFPFRVEPRR